MFVQILTVFAKDNFNSGFYVLLSELVKPKEAQGQRLWRALSEKAEEEKSLKWPSAATGLHLGEQSFALAHQHLTM